MDQRLNDSLPRGWPWAVAAGLWIAAIAAGGDLAAATLLLIILPSIVALAWISIRALIRVFGRHVN